MDYLQYLHSYLEVTDLLHRKVLNLIINGLPSIQEILKECKEINNQFSFKPYYKWITFNTLKNGSILDT